MRPEHIKTAEEVLLRSIERCKEDVRTYESLLVSDDCLPVGFIERLRSAIDKTHENAFNLRSELVELERYPENFEFCTECRRVIRTPVIQASDNEFICEPCLESIENDSFS